MENITSQSQVTKRARRRFDVRRFLLWACVMIMTVVVVFGGTRTYYKEFANKVVSTAVGLYVCYDNADFYNSQSRKTDAMTKDYLENQKIRESYYKNDNVVVRTYANSNILIKLLMIPIVLISYPFILLVDLLILESIFEIGFPKKKKRKANQKTARKG